MAAHDHIFFAVASDGKELGNVAVKANDGVRSSYVKFLSVKGLNETNASLFFQYLSESQLPKDENDGAGL